jgi:hypothetical protein
MVTLSSSRESYMSSIQIRDQMGMTMTHSALAEVKWGSIDFGAYPDRLDSQAGDRTPCVNFYVKKKKKLSNVGCLLHLIPNA